jgi:diacylglycerol kinase
MTRKQLVMQKQPYARPFPSAGPSRSGLNRPSNFLAGRWFSLSAAAAGAFYTVRTQPNAWIELAAIGVVVFAGWWFRVTTIEWAVLGLTSALLLALEAVNTAIETVVDLVSPQYHPLAKLAKDTAAGALLLAVLGSLVVALCIFGPRLWQWLA